MTTRQSPLAASDYAAIACALAGWALLTLALSSFLGPRTWLWSGGVLLLGIGVGIAGALNLWTVLLRGVVDSRRTSEEKP